MTPVPSGAVPLTVPQRVCWFVGVVGVLLGAVGIRAAQDPAWVNFFDNLHWTSATVATAGLAWLAWQRAAAGPHRDLHFWMACGATAYACGQIAWDVQVWIGYVAFPAPADALYLALGPCFVIACVRALRRPGTRGLRVAVPLLDAALFTAALTALVLVVYLPKRGDTEPAALLTLIAYPAVLFAAVATLVTTALTNRWRVSGALLSLFAGLLATALIWMRWNFLALDGLAAAGTWFNVSFSVAILAMAYGLTHWDQSVNRSVRWERFCEGVLRQLPMVFVVMAAVAVLMARHWSGLPEVIERIADISAGLVVMLAMARQSTLLREHDELLATQSALQSSQAALSLEQAQLKSVLNTIPDLVWLKNSEGVYLACNRSFEDFFGADAADIVGKTDYDFVPRELADFFRDNDRLALQEEHGRRNEESLTFARGGYQGIFETIKTPMRDAQGRLIGVLGIARDVSERKRFEKHLAIQADLLAHLTEGIHLATADTLTIVYANRQLEQMFGYAQNELLGQHVSVLNAPDVPDTPASQQRVQEALAHAGRWEGDVRNVRKDGTVFWSHAVVSGFLHPEHGQVWISVHEDATARKLAEEEVASLAFYDPLTGLPNRRLMLDRAQQALAANARSGKSGALLLIDLDNFKVLNDTLGHDVGDQLLKEVGQRLTRHMRDGDTVARLGGDEFVVILSGLESGDDGVMQAQVVARKIQHALNASYELTSRTEEGVVTQHQHQCSPSIGICIFAGPRFGVDELLKRADTAMYQAKRAGRNSICFYEPTMQQAIKLRAQTEEEIRRAIQRQEFVIYCQPQIDSAGALFGAEVLVRWLHPERGLVAPVEFIPVAEETGQIVAIGNLVLRGACEQLARWASDTALSGLALSVNVSALQMAASDFEQGVVSLIRETGVNPERLKLELTEGLLLNNAEAAIAKMAALRGHGVHFSLDDFGTGYSSLSYLKSLPLEQLKIDRSFVRDLLIDPNDEVIAKTVIALGHSLGLQVIAEGVETTEQRDVLRAAGCDAYQGYLFGKPMSVTDFEAFARSWAASAAL
ncbi:EAL domain-containing protein [Curvibacter sp. APW13]|uniref:EAL domain-containing protein n=1 Tax=Curvibacter sp. APW13 TaxID=3077236 RepID=UPI0028DE7D4E|nr:EAL domain-containing protein [Curvibacter sp. APW13]MDT8989362.1 EAL domain-containing protein [Curvibacter sp. APW13]